MTQLSKNPNSAAGLEAESRVLKVLSEWIEREKRDWILVHSVCSNQVDLHVDAPNVITWIESPKRNSQLGDIRIFKQDEHGRPLHDKFVCIDVKYSSRWDYSSITFRRTGDDPKADAVRHICNFVGSGMSSTDFWYLTIGKNGTYIFTLEDVRNFIRSSSKAEFLEMCQPGKYDEVTWYMSFEPIIDSIIAYENIENWLKTIDKRLG